VTESPAIQTNRGIARWAGLGGVLYVILFVVGILIVSSGQPDGDATPTKVIAYYSKGSHRDKIHIGTLLIIIGVFFLIWFVAALRQVVRSYAGDGLLTTVATIGGAIYAALTLAAFAANDAIKTMSDDTYRHQVFPELIHLADDLSYVLHSFGGVAAGAMMVAASLAALQARALPAWLCWLSVVAGISGIVSFFFIPWIVIGVWLIVAGILVTRVQARPASV
jgi:hypothetical protein